MDTPLRVATASFFFMLVRFFVSINNGIVNHCSSYNLIVTFTLNMVHIYIYTEQGSKNSSMGSAQLNVADKQVTGYATPSNEPRCIVFVLNLYFRV